MSTIKHRAETPIPPEKGDAVQTSISSEIFQQRDAIVAWKMNNSPFIGRYAFPQAEDGTRHYNIRCSNILSLGRGVSAFHRVLRRGCLPQQWSLETQMMIR